MSEAPMELEPIPIDGNDLEQINLRIQQLEAAAQEFVESKISIDQSGNEATFQPLPGGEKPPLLTIVLKGSPAPKKTKLVWQGKMIVEGKARAVEAYRA